ncbi:MAG: hypothetical protein GXP04_09550 [Alphaproteobacteria bacterium]|nr:hypothetical protein [Alphaproteobacteria bacterium]
MAEDNNTDIATPLTRSLTPEEQKKRQQRNIVLALSILGFVVIVFLVTILRLGSSVADRAF